MTRKAKRSSSRRGTSPILVLLLLLLIPACLIYLTIFLRQLEEIGGRNVRLLDTAATRIEKVVENSLRNVKNLANDPSFVEDFDVRQPFLVLRKLVWRKENGGQTDTGRTDPETRLLLQEDELFITIEALGEDAFRIDFDEILAQIPLDVFSGLLVADEHGKVIHRSPEWVGGLRLASLDPSRLMPPGSEEKALPEDAPPDLEQLHSATQVFEVSLSTARYRLFCQPLELPPISAVLEAEAPPKSRAWVVCGVSEAPGSIQEALLISPELTAILAFFLAFGIVTAPLFRLALLKRQERLFLRDGYFLVLSTFATLLLATIVLLDLDNYRQLRGDAEKALVGLAEEVSGNLRTELDAAYDQLILFDVELAEIPAWKHYLGFSFFFTLPEASRNDEFWSSLNAIVDGLCPVGGEDGGSSGSLALDCSLLLGPDAPAIFGLADEAPYAEFSSVFWMDETGLQRIKGTVRDQNTPQVRLDTRPYFRHVKEDRLWCVGDREYYVQAFRSITTGEHSSALSIRSHLTPYARHEPDAARTCKPCGPDDGLEVDAGEIVAAAISLQPMSVSQPVLPPGFGFAVVDAGGDVLYHSDSRHALDENFFDEVTDPRRLEAAVRSRGERHLRTRYLARPHQLYVSPVHRLPWSVITFGDEDPLKTVNLQAMVLAILLAAGYFLAFALVLATFLIKSGWSREVQMTWFWPHKSWAGLYRVLTFLYAALIVLVLLAFATLSRDGILLVTFGLWPLVGLITTAGFLAWRRWREKPDRSAEAFAEDTASRREIQRDPGWYYSASFLLWILVAVLAGGGFFTVAWEENLSLLHRYEDLKLGEELEERTCNIEELYREYAKKHPGIEDEEERAVVVNRYAKRAAARQERTLDLYVGSTFERRHVVASGGEDGSPGGETVEPSGFVDSLARFLPVYNDTSTRLTYLQRAAADGAWDWRRMDKKVLFDRTSPGNCGDWGHLLASPIAGPRPGVFSFVFGGGLLLVLFLWLRYSGRHLFFAEIGRQVDPLDIATLAHRRPDTNVVALIASPAARRELCESELYEPLDLEAAPDVDPEEDNLAAVLCENFEAGLDDPGRRRKKLAALERLQEAGRRVVILSALDPFAELDRLYGLSGSRNEDVKGSPSEQETAKQDSGQAVDAEEMRRWARLLSEFVVVPIDRRRWVAPTLKPATEGEKWVHRELGNDVQLTEVVMQGLRQGSHGDRASPGRLATRRKLLAKIAEKSRQEARERVLEAAQGYYWALWMSCSEDEKLVLVHLAQEKFVNPKQRMIVRRLLQRGLLERKPALRMINESFALFVERVHDPVSVRRWERSAPGLGWHDLRWAFGGLLGLLALFLFATQRELLENTLVFLSAMAVSLTTLIRLLKPRADFD